MAASNWDQRYREGSDRWELGKPAPPLEAFLRTDSRAPQPPGRVLVPGCGLAQLRWLQADLFDGAALTAAGIPAGSLQGVLEHTCFCAIDPAQREAYLNSVARLLAPGGWLLGLFWCHPRPDGPPWGSDPAQLAQQLAAAGFHQEIWEPAQGSATERDNEWLGLWRR